MISFLCYLRFNPSPFIYTPRGLKPHPLRVVRFVLGFKSPLQNVITNYELRITNCLIGWVRNVGYGIPNISGKTSPCPHGHPSPD